MGSALVILVVVVALALAFDYINGFHDTANAVATVISTGVLPGRTAVLLAAVCNFVGAFLSLRVAGTIGRDIADPASVTQVVWWPPWSGRFSGTCLPGTTASRPARRTHWSVGSSVPSGATGSFSATRPARPYGRCSHPPAW